MTNITIIKRFINIGMAAGKQYLEIIDNDEDIVIGYIQPTYLHFGSSMTHTYIVQRCMDWKTDIFSTVIDACDYLDINEDEFCAAAPKDWEKERQWI